MAFVKERDENKPQKHRRYKNPFAYFYKTYIEESINVDTYLFKIVSPLHRFTFKTVIGDCAT